MLKIVIADFPYIDDLDEYRKRPAVCLTKPIGKYNIVVVAFITTNTKEGLPTDIIVDAKDAAFPATKLHTTSCIKVNKLVSVPLAKLQGEIGALPPKWEKEVRDKLRLLFNL
jgi:mRNA-degrading endonuclease toxin of MazEF toxin-antitoxin module